MSGPAEGATLSSISVLGAGHEAEATALNDEILQLLSKASRAETAAHLGASLKELKARSTHFPSAHLKAESATLALSAQHGVAELKALLSRTAPIDHGLVHDLAELNAERDLAAVRAGDTDALSDSLVRVSLDRRILILQAARQSLYRCRLLIEENLSTARQEDDQMSLLNDVTVPIAVRNAGVSQLSAEADRSNALASGAEASWTDMIQKDAERLKQAGDARLRQRQPPFKANMWSLASAKLLDSVLKGRP